MRYVKGLSRQDNSQSIQQSKISCGILIAHNKATYLIGPMRLESCGSQTHLKPPVSKQRVQMANIYLKKSLVRFPNTYRGGNNKN